MPMVRRSTGAIPMHREHRPAVQVFTLNTLRSTSRLGTRRRSAQKAQAPGAADVTNRVASHGMKNDLSPMIAAFGPIFPRTGRVTMTAAGRRAAADSEGSVRPRGGTTIARAADGLRWLKLFSRRIRMPI